MNFTSQNHYVPQWYQKRFYLNDSKDSKVYYLDLSPKKIKQEDGGTHYKKAIRELGTKKSFKQEHLYTLFFKNCPSDVIEKRFFGAIDDLGVKAFDFFSKYEVNEESALAFQNIMRFMDAQKLRTPKGLDYIKNITGKDDPQHILNFMGKLHQMHT